MIETTPDISLSHYANRLREGHVIAFPTETVYGLGANAWNADAIARVFALKGRPPDNPLIVHVSSLEMVNALVTEISADARALMDQFWPGPLTIIFPKRPEVLDIVTAGIHTVAVRMPNHPIPLRLIEEAGPLAAPSANTSGRPSPTKAEHVRHDFGDEIPVIEGGSCQYGLESTVLDLSQHPYTVLRPGHITQSELETTLGQPVRMAGARPVVQSDAAPRSPGMKYTHYAPDAGVRWMRPDELPWPSFENGKTLYLLHTLREDQNIPGPASGAGMDIGQAIPRTSLESLIHYQEDYIEMARDLYDRFRMADLKGYEEIAIEPFPAWHEMTEALLNRIRKAIGD